MQAWEESFEMAAGRRRVVLTKWLVGINVAVFLLQGVTGDLVPGRLGWMSEVFGLSREGLASGYVWQIVSYMFLHGGVFHIVANMLVIYFAGVQVEGLLGPRRFLMIYFLGGIVGGLVQTVLSPGLLVGASAAGFAVLIAFTTIQPELRLTLLLFFVVPLRVKAKHLALGAFAVSLIFAVFPPGDNVGHLAHLFGCITGWVCVRKMGFGGRRKGGRGWYAQMIGGSGRPVEPTLEEIDRILDKVSRLGMQSLTREERLALEAGRESIIRRPPIR